MAAPMTVLADALDGVVQYFERMPKVANTAMRMAINDMATRSGVKRGREEIMKQVAFKREYLADPNKLGVTKRATDGDLEAIITARSRATSLARFGVGDMTPGVRKKGQYVQVMVKTGTTRTLKKAFPIRLRRGASLTEDSFNLGLAIRLKPGESIVNKREMSAAEIGHGLYLLYGPSVDQIFRNVADEIAPEVAADTADEFIRQFVRLTDG